MRWTRRLAGEQSSWVVLRESTTLHREDIGTSIDWNSSRDMPIFQGSQFPVQYFLFIG
jgi:hypothetical protein